MWIISVALRIYGWTLAIGAGLQVLQGGSQRSWLALAVGVGLIAGGRSLRDWRLIHHLERWEETGARAARRRQARR